MTDPAHARAAEAALAAGVQVRDLRSVEEIGQACRLLDDIWGLAPGSPSEVQPALLLALAHTGNYVRAAYAGDELVGASVGFFAAGNDLHSHITGVRQGARGAGSALKWDQRAWALDRGRTGITWTFDPLIARNAYFNLARLGARPIRYLVNFYGVLADGRNIGQPTDRMMVRWDLTGQGPATDPAPDGDELAVLWADGDGRPQTRPPDRDRVRLQIPSDIEGLRVTDPELALAWRLALREMLGQLVPGWRTETFRRAGWYVLRRD